MIPIWPGYTIATTNEAEWTNILECLRLIKEKYDIGKLNLNITLYIGLLPPKYLQIRQTVTRGAKVTCKRFCDQLTELGFKKTYVTISGYVEKDWVYTKKKGEYGWHSIIYGPGLEDRFDEYFDGFFRRWGEMEEEEEE